LASNMLTVRQCSEMFQYVAQKVMENRQMLSDADSAIGDGDHGTGMYVGFSNASRKLQESDFKTVNELFQAIGMALISSMGGASGVIFGSLFTGGVKPLSPLEQVDLSTLTLIFEHGLAAVKARGKANPGDKTMVDALEPAVRKLRECCGQDTPLPLAVRAAAESAREGAEQTKQYIARFGRAKTLGDRSIGFPDAGAVSVSIIFQAMSEWLEQHDND